MAEDLARALEDPRAPDPHGGAELARAIAAAHAPKAIDAAAHASIVERALAEAETRKKAAQLREESREKRGKIVRIAFGGTAAALALAAAVVFVLGRIGDDGGEATAALVPVHSTQALFDEPFPRAGGASARLDRIATARAGDLRANLFASWGVRDVRGGVR
jgi:hypothetical protein